MKVRFWPLQLYNSSIRDFNHNIQLAAGNIKLKITNKIVIMHQKNSESFFEWKNSVSLKHDNCSYSRRKNAILGYFVLAKQMANATQSPQAMTP